MLTSSTMIIHPSNNNKKKWSSVEEKRLIYSLNTQTVRCKKGLETVLLKTHVAEST